MRHILAPTAADLHFLREARDNQLAGSPSRAALDKAVASAPHALADYRSSIPANLRLAPTAMLDAEVTLLKAAYKSSRKAKGPGGLRAAVLENPSNSHTRCCYCELGPAKQLDHFAPQKSNSEMVLEVVNLVPSCSACNGTKLSLQIEANGMRLPHPYLDPAFPDRYLFATVRASRGELVAKFRVANLGADPASRSIQLLTQRLQLLTRYTEEGTMLLSEEKETIDDLAPGDLENWANKERDKLVRKYHQNHWKAVLYDGLSHAASTGRI